MNRGTGDYESFYEALAQRYHGSRYGGRYGRLFRALHHACLADLLLRRAPGRVLKVACGTGHTTELLDSNGIDYVACDLTQAMLAQSDARLGNRGRLVRANALALPFGTATFDNVVSTRFLHLFDAEHQRAMLAEMIRVLRPGGRLIVDFDNFASRWILALPHLLYNLLAYRRLAPDTHYNRIGATERMLAVLGLDDLRSEGVGGYLLVIPAMFSAPLAYRAGRALRPLRCLTEQFVTTGIKR